MNTLDTPQVTTLLTSLFAESEQAERKFRMPRGLDPSSKTNYREYYAGMKHLALPVSRETGMLLYCFVRSMQASSIIEFGTSFGISAIYIAAALRDNNKGGRLITTEFETGKVFRARENLMKAGLLDLVEVREGDAMKTLTRDLPPTVDFLLLDGAKGLYLDVIDLVTDRLRPGALILADDTNLCPGYVQTMRREVLRYVSLPLARDVELSVKLQ